MASKGTMKRPQEGDTPLVSGRKTTLPDPLTPPGSPAYDGPPADGLEKHLAYLEGLDRRPLHLVGLLPERQVRQDATFWFPGAQTYNEETAAMMRRAPDLFKDHVNHRGENIDRRLARLGTLAKIVAQEELLLRLFKDALIAEAADVTRLSDASVGIMEAKLKLPVLEPGQEQNLQSVAEGPLRVWRERNAGIQQQKQANAALRTEHQDVVDQAVASAVASRLLERIHAGEALSHEDVLYAVAHSEGKAPPAEAVHAPDPTLHKSKGRPGTHTRSKGNKKGNKRTPAR